MVYTYTPTYYSSLQDSITSICKNILPFSFKKKRLPAIAAAEQQLAKQQSDNLKWQQESFHQILNLMGLCQEGIIHENEVGSFRTHLLETLIASPFDHEPPVILRDKLIFLQELLYAKCISDEEYHASKRPLLQRLAVQGAEIEARDVTIGSQKETSSDAWTIIDLKDEKHPLNREAITSKHTFNEDPSIKPIKGSASAFDFVSPNKYGRLKEEKDVRRTCNRTIKPIAEYLNSCSVKKEFVSSMENPFWNSSPNDKENESKSILMMENLPAAAETAEKQSGNEKAKRKPFRTLFPREQKAGVRTDANERSLYTEEKGKVKSSKKHWGFDGFMKWKKNNCEDERAPLSLCKKSDVVDYTGQLITNPIGEGPDTKQIKSKSDFFVDKVLGDNIKKELSCFQAEPCLKNPAVQLSSCCDRYGDVMLDVVRKDHVGTMGNSRATAQEKQNQKRWTTFDDEENSHPNLFTSDEQSIKRPSLSSSKNATPTRTSFNSSIDKGFKYNPFFDV